MAQPRTTNSIAQTNHATNNVWIEVKPENQNGGDICRLFTNSTEAYNVFVAALGVEYTADPAGAPSTSDAAMLAASFAIASGADFDFGGGVTNAIWVSKVAAAATDQQVNCLY